jgi:hypothetical protein
MNVMLCYLRSGLNYIVCCMTTFQTAELQADCYTIPPPLVDLLPAMTCVVRNTRTAVKCTAGHTNRIKLGINITTVQEQM